MLGRNGSIKFHLMGVPEMSAKIQAVIKHFPEKVEKAAMAEMRIELREVFDRTPWDTKALRESERLAPPAWKWNKIIVQILVGGPDIDYALRIHEDMEMLHPRGGQAKFLESVLLESAPFMVARIAARMGFTPADIV